MREISLHILDIVQNSVTAGAGLIYVTVVEDREKDILTVEIKDNGRGMSEEMAKSVQDPFVTSRTTRRVGLGIPLLKHAAQAADGSFELTSKEGAGTEIRATFRHSHIDRQPLGDMAQTMLGLITSYQDIDFVYVHSVDGNVFTADTREIKNVLNGVSLSEPDVVAWLSEYLLEGEEQISFKEVKP